MTTLMLSPQMSEDSQQLRRAAIDRGWQVVRWVDWHKPEGLPSDDLCLYASPLFAARVSELTGWNFLEPPDDWLTKLPTSLLKRTITFTTLGMARKIPERRFFKPANFKTFKAAVYPDGRGLPDDQQGDPDNPVLVSEVVNWNSEFRFFLRDGKALTGSVYFRDGRSAQVDGDWPSSEEEFSQARETAEAAFAATAALLPTSVVIDTGFIEGQGWAVIEANPAWGSGLYGADPDKVLEVISGCGFRSF